MSQARDATTSTLSAIWLEASDQQWESASALTHVAVALHFSSASMWSQVPRTHTAHTPHTHRTHTAHTPHAPPWPHATRAAHRALWRSGWSLKDFELAARSPRRSFVYALSLRPQV